MQLIFKCVLRSIWLKLLKIRRKLIQIHVTIGIVCIGVLLVLIAIELYDRNTYDRLIYVLGLRVFKMPIYIEKNEQIMRSELPDCNHLIDSDDQIYHFFDGIKYPRYIPLYQNKKLNFTCLNKITKRNRILLWNTFFGNDHYHYGIGNHVPFADNKCPVTNCEITNNKELVNESDLILFHGMEKLYELPKWKFDYQRYVFYNYESPLNTLNFAALNNVFNMSSTYRLDSNTTSLYFVESSFYWTQESQFDDNIDYLSTKDRFSAIVVSNCRDKMNRMGMIKELQKYIPVTVYGDCGITCVYDCQKTIGYKYKFYFAFENSFCKDYITEKFFGMLKYNIIPVVLGGGQYDLFIPKSGYISALDYETPKDLAEYLLYLSTNKTAYNSYFKWKKHVIFDSYNPYLGHICELCILLNMDAYKSRIERHLIQDMNKFWHPLVDCKKPDFDHKTFKFKSF